MARMRVALTEEVARDDACVIAEYENRFSQIDKLCRKGNRDFLIKLNNAMLRCLGYGLLAFLPQRRPRPLLPGERRYIVNYQSPGEEHARPRVCVDHGDGRKSFEVPTVKRNGLRVYPIIHFAQDQGSIGLPAILFLQSALGLRCTMVWDCFHRMQNDLELAQADAGLLVLKLEMLQVTKLRVGPWGKIVTCLFCGRLRGKCLPQPHSKHLGGEKSWGLRSPRAGGHDPPLGTTRRWLG